MNNPPFLQSQFVHVKGGTFLMGGDASTHADEQPQHAVTVQDFYICKFPVTQELWTLIWKRNTGEEYNPSQFSGLTNPVDGVTWWEAKDFVYYLNAMFQTSPDEGFRLPTEAEWEYAARGGQLSQGFLYAGSNDPDEVAWYEQNSGGQTQPVGLKKPNELGLHDMNGNVWEWCEDHWHANYDGAPTDGSAWDDEPIYEARIFRGASWANFKEYLRVSFRASNGPNSRNNAFGLRLVWGAL